MCTDNQEDIQNKKIEGLTDLSVEILPARINPNKPHCPKCHVTVTDIGTCPYCETIVINKWKPAPTKEKYEIISKKGLNKKETVAFKKVDNSFFNQFALTNFNFDVQIHRKVGGKEEIMMRNSEIDDFEEFYDLFYSEKENESEVILPWHTILNLEVFNG